jgi:thiamine-phosphate pyrophosphorylase
MGTPDLTGTPVPPGSVPPKRAHALGAFSLDGIRVVAITDRRRMVPADLLATGDSAPIAAAFAAAIQRAVAGCTPGSIVIQVREKDLDGRLLFALVRAAQPFAPVAVNDRLDVALAADAWAVHLPERGLAVSDARAIAAAIFPGLVIGASRHAGTIDADANGRAAANAGAAGADHAASPGDIAGADHAASPGDFAGADHAAGASAGADLIQLGPIWPTPSKPGAPTLGEAALARPGRRFALVAVGGIDTPERAERAAAAGADAVAVIRAAWTGDSLAPFVAAVTAGRARR